MLLAAATVSSGEHAALRKSNVVRRNCLEENNKFGFGFVSFQVRKDQPAGKHYVCTCQFKYTREKNIDILVTYVSTRNTDMSVTYVTE